MELAFAELDRGVTVTFQVKGNVSSLSIRFGTTQYVFPYVAVCEFIVPFLHSPPSHRQGRSSPRDGGQASKVVFPNLGKLLPKLGQTSKAVSEVFRISIRGPSELFFEPLTPFLKKSENFGSADRPKLLYFYQYTFYMNTRQGNKNFKTVFFM